MAPGWLIGEVAGSCAPHKTVNVFSTSSTVNTELLLPILKTHWLTSRQFGTAIALTTDEEKGHSQDRSCQVPQSRGHLQEALEAAP
jgi:hypothetical protein